MTALKPFKTYTAARRYSGANPIIRVGNIYLGTTDTNTVSLGLTSVDLIGPKGHITGTVSMRHLERLGNGNYAVAKPGHGYGGGEKLFPPEAFK